MEENKNQENLNDENSFKSVAPNTINNQAFKEKKVKNNNGTGFVKTVLLPFTCGVLGAGIVVGTCFGVPSIRDNILSGFVTEEGDTSTPADLNTQQISLLDYSDTAVGVAQKVLPSIVGINVTYSVNSIFYGN